MKLLIVLLVSVCLPGILGDYYGVAPSYNPPYSYSPPAYNPPYSAPAYPSYQPSYYPTPSYQPPYYSPPYYETYDIQVDYKEANSTLHCGVLPAVHHPYGYEKDRVSFGQYPWQVLILDNYNNYKCAGGLISPRHVITSSYCVDSMDLYNIRVRVGEYDVLTDKNYEEVYKNYELTVCKKHPFYPIPGSYGYDQYASYPVTILELYADVDFDQYPQVEPVCLPEFYYLSKSYTNEYTSYGYGYGYGGGSSPAPMSSSSSSQRNEEGADKDLECIVLGYQESPQEKFSYQSSAPSYNPPSYGYGQSYAPSYSYESYEYSRTPRRAKLHKVYSYTPQYNSYGYTPQVDTWEAEYYFDACHADLGSPIFCLVEGRYEEEEYYPAYPVSYPETYQPSYSPPAYPSYQPPSYSYQPPSYSYQPPSYSYQPPSYSYQPPSYTPTYQPPYYTPSYDSPRYRRDAYSPPYYTPSYSYQPPSYQPSYQPTYQPSYYSPPVYEDSYKYPIKVAEPLNREYRRAVLYGVVQYPTQCSYGYGQSSNQITSTPVKGILSWIENIIHTPASCAAYQAPAYSYPTYY